MSISKIEEINKKEIDHSIDVRYEEDVIKAFNKFIEKWCGDYFPHLIDDDENDGEFMREKIRENKSLRTQQILSLIEELEGKKKL